MHQNIVTVQNIMNCKNKFDESTVNQTRTIVPYDLTKTKYEVGQWVDVKDTIDQWLEAQVVQVRNNQAFVHYNGWANRWDEWIDFSSPRIASFKYLNFFKIRTYTVQSPTSVFLSPYPSVACDINVEPQPRSIDSFYYMEKATSCMNEVLKMVDTVGRLRKKNQNKNLNQDNLTNKDTILNNNTNSEFEEKSNDNINNKNAFNFTMNDYEMLHITTQLVPIMDRLGRLCSGK